MKRFFTLSFLFLSLALYSQNLIPDGSVEDVAECPSSLGNVDIYSSSWQVFRGSPDYWHSCSDNSLLGWNNSQGFQTPRTGEGYLGAFLHHTNLPNAREYFGVQLNETLAEGQQYYLSFFTSMAYRVTGGSRTACNNLGVFLMEENILDSNEQGETPNFASFALDTILKDTTSWVHIEYSFIADEAYSHIAFGNFFDDSLTDFEFPFEPDNAGIAYYYFDDFCLSNNPVDCDPFLNVESEMSNLTIEIWPNPSNTGSIHFKTSFNPNGFRLFSMDGKELDHKSIIYSKEGLIEHQLKNGIYIIEFYSQEHSVKKRFVVQ
jgi:hypothetical protein